MHGNVSANAGQPSLLVIGKKAHITGDVSASILVVDGTVVGQVNSSETLELQPNARIKGNVHYKTIQIERGAIVDGRLAHYADVVSISPELKLASND